MIFTSYFAKIKQFPKNVIPVAICAKVPEWYTGLRYSKLAPKYDVLMKYKNDHNEADYTKCFRETTLALLRPHWVIGDLMKKAYPFGMNPNVHVALICYEKPSEFCHRHVIAEWFREYGIECREWEEDPTYSGDEKD